MIFIVPNFGILYFNNGETPDSINRHIEVYYKANE